jgi:hypothetical protein
MDAEQSSISRAAHLALARSKLPLPRPDAIMDETCDADDSKQPGHDLPRRIPRLSELPTREAVLQGARRWHPSLAEPHQQGLQIY